MTSDPEFRAPEGSADNYVYQRFGRRDWRTLHDLLVFGGRADRLVARGKSAYDADEMLRYAGKMLCIDIGEAASRLSDDLVQAHPEILFRKMREQRNFAAHRYESIDTDIIWETPAESFPGDRDKIADLIERPATEPTEAGSE